MKNKWTTVIQKASKQGSFFYRSPIGVYLSARTQYAWKNGFVPSGIGFTMSILNGTFLGFFAVGAFGLVFVLYGMFKPASNAEQRAT